MSDYSDYILDRPTPPALYWTLDDPSGTTATDLSGNSRPGTINGTVQLGQTAVLPSGVGASMKFDNSTGYIERAHESGLNLSDGSPFTVEFWYKMTSAETTNTAARFLATKGSIGVTNYKNFMIYDNGGTTDIDIFAGFRHAGGSNAILSEPGIPYGTHYITYVVDPPNNDHILYVDGVEAAANRNLTTGTPEANTDAIRVGNSLDAGERAKGWIDEFAITRAVLTAEQILETYNAGLGSYPAGTGNPIRMII